MKKRKNDLSSEEVLEDLDELMTVNKSAKFLGVTGKTLRNWDKAQKIPTYRHPVNRYRLFKKRDLLNILLSIKIKNNL